MSEAKTIRPKFAVEIVLGTVQRVAPSDRCDAQGYIIFQTAAEAAFFVRSGFFTGSTVYRVRPWDSYAQRYEPLTPSEFDLEVACESARNTTPHVGCDP